MGKELTEEHICKINWAWVFGLYESVTIMNKNTYIPDHYWWDKYSNRCLEAKAKKEEEDQNGVG